MHTFGDTLIYYRSRQGLTQKELAEHISMTRDHISALECGDALPRYTTMEKLAKALECHPAEFFPDWKVA